MSSLSSSLMVIWAYQGKEMGIEIKINRIRRVKCFVLFKLVSGNWVLGRLLL